MAFDSNRIISVGTDDTMRYWSWGKKDEVQDKFHVLNKGETLITVSKFHSLPMADLMKWNGITEPNQVTPLSLSVNNMYPNLALVTVLPHHRAEPGVHRHEAPHHTSPFPSPLTPPSLLTPPSVPPSSIILTPIVLILQVYIGMRLIVRKAHPDEPTKAEILVSAKEMKKHAGQ